MRALLLVLALGVAACGSQKPPAASFNLANVPPCGAGDTAPTPSPDNPFTARQCKIEEGSQRFLVRFAAANADAAGTINVDVLSADGSVSQTLTEANVDTYIDPDAADLDADGHLDLEIIRSAGNVNNDMGIWRFDPATSRYRRVGEVSAYGLSRTADGYLAAPNRGGAAQYEISFYRFEPTKLTLLLSVDVEAEANNQDRVTSTTCTIAERGPGFASLNLDVEVARRKFCAEPSAKVFDDE